MTTIPDELDRAFPESHIPERPSRLEAIFDRFSIGLNKDGDEVPIAVLEIDGRLRGLWLHTRVLRGEFRKLRPDQGERVAVKFAGEKTESAAGFSYWPDRVGAPDRPAVVVTADHPAFGDPDAEPDATSDVPADADGLPVARDEIPF